MFYKGLMVYHLINVQGNLCQFHAQASRHFAKMHTYVLASSAKFFIHSFKIYMFFLKATAPGQVEELFGKRRSNVRRSARAAIGRHVPLENKGNIKCPNIIFNT